MGNEITLGLKIKEARENKKLTQKELADKLDVSSDKVVSSWERDRTKPDYDSIVKICQVLDVSLNYLFGSDASDYYDSVSPLEISIIEDFRMLDEAGQSVVLYNLQHQKERCMENKINIDNEFAVSKSMLTKKDLFLEKSNLQYEAMREKTKILSKLKKNSYLTYESMFHYLCLNGYSGLICIADLVMIMHRVKVPSPEFYKEMEEILNRSQC